jgi:hypothetical protein
VPLPGSENPSASVRQFIELAVNIPEHEPQVGHAERSKESTSSSEQLLSPPLTIASTRSTAITLPPHFTLPASIGPPETNMVGIFTRIAAINIPGVILSQFEMHTIASAQCALTMYSTESGDQVTRRQRIKHAVVPHGNAVINGDGIEFLGDTAGGLDFASDQLSYILEMHVPRNELGERIDDGNDRLAEISVLHASGAPESARARHVAAMCRSAGTIVGHCRSPIQNTPEGGAI